MRYSQNSAWQFKRSFYRVLCFATAIVMLAAMTWNEFLTCGLAQDEIRGEVLFGLRGKVRILIDENSNTVTIAGSKEDVAKVKRVILDTKNKLQASTGIVSARIRLEYQQAEAVAEILNHSMRTEESHFSSLRIHAVHFPEGIWLSGSATAVKRAMATIFTIDSFENSRIKFRP